MSFFFAELGEKSSWTALDYVNKFSKFWKFNDNCERISERDVDCDEFIERYEKQYKPVVIEDVQVRIILTHESMLILIHGEVAGCNRIFLIFSFFSLHKYRPVDTLEGQ